jgi:hypothetical protein
MVNASIAAQNARNSWLPLPVSKGILSNVPRRSGSAARPTHRSAVLEIASDLGPACCKGTDLAVRLLLLHRISIFALPDLSILRILLKLPIRRR